MNNFFHSKNLRQNLVLILVVCILLGFIWIENKPNEKEEISVILYHAGNNGWDSLQEGVKQAGDDFSVNVNFIVMREDASEEEQIETIEREISNGANGILLAANDSERLKAALEAKSFNLPIVTVESGIEDSDIPCIAADDYAMGQRLGEEIRADYFQKEDLKIVINSTEKERNSVLQRELGFIDSMGTQAQIIPYEEWDGKSVDVVVALHKNSLLDVIEKEDTFSENVKIYGIGGSAPIVAALDQRKIDKIVFQNEFNIGYLGMDMLLDQVRNRKVKDIPQIDYYCVGREELYGTEYEPLLFTITE